MIDREHSVMATIVFKAPVLEALVALDRVNAMLRELRRLGCVVDCDVFVEPMEVVMPSVSAAIAEAENG